MASRRSKRGNTADSLIEEELSRRLVAIETESDADALAVFGSMLVVMDDFVKAVIEAHSGRRKKRLAVILETDGGSIELVQRIVETLRHHYKEVVFIVPNQAMSAGTVLALSGDAILMNYYSMLGPIDPQIRRGHSLLPAIGYLEFYRRLVDKSAKNQLTVAEMTYLIEKFDPAEMFQIEEHRELSITLLKEWLVKFKFKNWKTTKGRGVPVTRSMKMKRAEEIANKLLDPKLWHSHGRGISMDVLQRQIKVQIDDFDKQPALAESLKAYHEPMTHYLMRIGKTGVVHSRNAFMPISW